MKNCGRQETRRPRQFKIQIMSLPAGRVPLPMLWRKIAMLVIWLLLILALDLLLNSSRPELMEMGSRLLRKGALVFGRGYATLPFIHDTVVN